MDSLFPRVKRNIIYSYAMIDYEKMEITYVYIKDPPHNHHQISISNDYLPINYQRNMSKKTADNLKYVTIGAIGPEQNIKNEEFKNAIQSNLK